MEQRFIALRKHLNELGYRESLVIESVPLVERLLADLVKTTESLFHYKNVAQSAIEERDKLQLGVEPYKCDNAKLVKECNDLHLAFLQFREETDKSRRDLMKKVRCLEEENDQLNRHLTDLQKCSSKLTSSNIKHRTIHSKTSFTSKHSAVSGNTAKPVKSEKQKHICEPAMHAEYESDKSLRNKVKKLTLELSKQDEKTECLTKMLNNREREIKRLSTLLEGGRPADALNKDCCYQDVSSKLQTLTEENSKLSSEMKDLKIELEEAISKQHEAMKRALQLADRNKELERELKDIDQMALAVEEECNTVLKKNNSKVSKIEEQLQESHSKVRSLEKEINDLKHNKHALEKAIRTVKDEKENLHSILENTLDDKKKMTDKINEFTRIENDLNLEIDRLMQTCTLQKRKITDLEYLLNKESSENEIKSLSKSQISQDKCASCHKTKRKLKSDEFGKLETDDIAQKLKEERDYYQQECQRLYAEVSDTSTSDRKHILKEREEKIAKLEREILELTREKHTLLSKIENNDERNKLSLEGDSASFKKKILRLEKERDLARGDVRRIEEERDSLKKRLKTSIETHVSERDRLKKLMSDSEEKIRKLELERHEILSVHGSRRATINNLEEQTESLTSQLRTTQAELEHVNTLYNQIKILHEQTDRSLAGMQSQLSQMELEYAYSQQRVRELEKDRTDLDNELSSLKNDVSVLKENLMKVDCQRDNLLIEVDNKTERIASLEQELKCERNQTQCLELSVSELRRQLGLYTDDAAAKEFQLKSSCTELTSIKSELNSTILSKSHTVAENRRLQNELALITAEYRTCTSNLERCHREIEDLKRQLQQYVYEVKKAEDLISQKESERAEMLNQFRSLTEEATVLETSNHSLETKAVEVKNKLSAAETRIQDLENMVERISILNKDYEKEIQKLTCQVASMETKMKQQTNSSSKVEADLASMKELCCKLDKQKDALVKETEDSRIYNNYNYESSLDDDEICKITININYEKEKDHLQVEINKLKKLLDQEQANINSLENLLSQSRQESVEQRLINQDLQAEILRLKSLIEELQSKLTVTSQQLDVFQEKALDYSQQLKQLRREIANERFRAHSGDISSRYPSL